MSNKLKTFKPKKIKFKKNEQPTVAMPDMYTLNKQMMAKEPLLTPEQFEDIKTALHSSLEFGDYGLQNGDNKATISEEKQFNYTAKYTTELLDKIK